MQNLIFPLLEEALASEIIPMLYSEIIYMLQATGISPLVCFDLLWL